MVTGAVQRQDGGLFVALVVVHALELTLYCGNRTGAARQFAFGPNLLYSLSCMGMVCARWRRGHVVTNVGLLGGCRARRWIAMRAMAIRDDGLRFTR